ncbi:hypothetical protein BJ741DRAFT_601782 [Chytriomyces cf. hyalinus JEL632]|nr:hypothetical protein BJ741DRAFT_601782 [Chytriomyces cf. hyalinus JEL632]
MRTNRQVVSNLVLIPMGVGTSLSAHIAVVAQILSRSKTTHETVSHTMHSNGTTLSGDLASIWSLIRACVEALHAAGVVRVLTSFVFQTKDASGSEVKASRAIPANLLFATGVISARQLATSAEFDSAVENLARAMAKNAVRTEIHNSNIHVEGDWEAVGQALDCACIESMECHITLQTRSDAKTSLEQEMQELEQEYARICS